MTRRKNKQSTQAATTPASPSSRRQDNRSEPLKPSLLPSLIRMIKLPDEERVTSILAEDARIHKQYSDYLKHIKEDVGIDNRCHIPRHPKECWICRKVRFGGMEMRPMNAEEMEEALVAAVKQTSKLTIRRENLAPVKPNETKLSYCFSNESRVAFFLRNPHYWMRTHYDIEERINNYAKEVRNRPTLRLTPEPEWDMDFVEPMPPPKTETTEVH